MRLRSVGQASRRVRPVHRTRRAGGRAAALAIMWRGADSGTVRLRTRASPTIAKSISIDQLNVAMTSIRFPTTRRRPRRAVGRRCGGMPTIREILTVARCARCVRTRQYGVPMRNSTRPVKRIDGDRQARDSGSLQQGRGIRSRQAGTSRRGERKAEDIRPIPSGHIHARDAMSSTSEMGETAGGGWPARRSGPWQWLIEAGGASPVWPAKRPGRLPG